MEHVKRMRAERGMTQTALAVAAGMDPATLNRIEQGKANPNVKTLEKLADALEIEVADFFPKVEPSLFDNDVRRPISAGTIETMRGNIRYPDAARLFFAATAVAESVEHTVARESASLEELDDAVTLVVDFYPHFNWASKRWMEEAPTRLRERLRDVGDRLKAARRAALEAFGQGREEARRTAERKALNVVKLRDEERRTLKRNVESETA